MGQLGSVFSEAFLKMGRPVVPVLRHQSIAKACTALKSQEPEIILLAVGEDDLAGALCGVPASLRDRVVLIQNELRVSSWSVDNHAAPHSPSGAIVWFEKKPKKSIHLVLPSVLFGPPAPLILGALKNLEISARTVDTPDAIAHELVLKNLYILGLNLAGMRVGGNAGQLLSSHEEYFLPLFEELFHLESTLLQEESRKNSGSYFREVTLNKTRLLKDLREAIHSDALHACSGRSAPRRLKRTLSLGRTLGIQLPVLAQLKKDFS